eukprot:4807703-Pyramimonas_sp.AAC.1
MDLRCGRFVPYSCTGQPHGWLATGRSQHSVFGIRCAHFARPARCSSVHMRVFSHSHAGSTACRMQHAWRCRRM